MEFFRGESSARAGPNMPGAEDAVLVAAKREDEPPAAAAQRELSSPLQARIAEAQQVHARLAETMAEAARTIEAVSPARSSTQAQPDPRDAVEGAMNTATGTAQGDDGTAGEPTAAHDENIPPVESIKGDSASICEETPAAAPDAPVAEAAIPDNDCSQEDAPAVAKVQATAAAGLVDDDVTGKFQEESAEDVEDIETPINEVVADNVDLLEGDTDRADRAQVRWSFVSGFASALPAGNNLGAAAGPCQQPHEELKDGTGAECMQRAWHLLEGGNPQAAVQAFTEAMALKPGDVDVLSSRATAHLQCGNTDAAIRDLEECIRLHPDHPRAGGDPEAFLRLANLYIASGNLVKALELVDRGLRSHPSQPQLKMLQEEYSVRVWKDPLSANKSAPDQSSQQRGEHAVMPIVAHHDLRTEEFGDNTQQGHDDYRWQRLTLSGRWYSPVTETMSAVEARQRKIREKCVQQNRRKELKRLRSQQQRLQVQAEQERMAQIAAKKSQEIRQLDIILECITTLQNEKILPINAGCAQIVDDSRRGNDTLLGDRFSSIEDVITEMQAFLDKHYASTEVAIPAQTSLYARRSPEKKTRLQQDRVDRNQNKAAMVNEIVHHIVSMRAQPASRNKWSRSAALSRRESSATEVPAPLGTTILRKSSSVAPSHSVRTHDLHSPTGWTFPTLLAGTDCSGRGAAGAGAGSSASWSAGEAQQWRAKSDGPGIKMPEIKHSPRFSRHVSLPSRSPSASTTPSASISRRGSAMHENRAQRSSSGLSKLLLAERDPGPSYTKLPVKTWSSSLAFRCGIPSRGGFL